MIEFSANKKLTNDQAYSKRHDKSLIYRNNYFYRENPIKDNDEQKFCIKEHNGYYKTTNLPTKGRPKQGLEPKALTQHQPDRLQGRRGKPKEEHQEDQSKDIKMKPLPTQHHMYCNLYII